ncbi:MAG: MinD/ParA family protein [Deltaproteobacteria bacterium]|nr:MinD/ParA family protein [Deltaproteobacteria bacterium]
MTDTTDQAAGLRDRVEPTGTAPRRQVPVLAIASGKGGVGKSNIAVNLSCQLAKLGKRVLLFDADFGLGNTDILLGIPARYTLAEVVLEGRRLEEIALHLESGVTLIPAGSGEFSLANAETMLLEGIFFELERFIARYDIVIVDTGAGIGQRVRDTLLFSDQIAIITTPDPASLTDSYATVKMVAQRDPAKPFAVIVNMADRPSQAEATFAQLARVAKKYLNLTLESWGGIPNDERVAAAIRRQKAVTECFPNTPASVAIGKIAAKIVNKPFVQGGGGSGVRGFLRQFFRQREEGRVAVTV